MKVLLDMNLAPRWVEFLELAGLPAAHWSDIGAADATDAEIMSHARDNGCWVITHDLDFGSILAASQSDGPASFSSAAATFHRKSWPSK